MAETEALFVRLTASTRQLEASMREAARAMVRLGDAMFASLPWWSRIYLSVLHPIRAFQRWRRTQHKAGSNG